MAMTGTDNTRTAISWSGGKDSCLALRRALAAGLDVRTFVTMCEDDGSSIAHAVPAEVMEAQVARFGARWLSVRVPVGGYAAAFTATLAELRSSGHATMVFGDIDLKAHRDWIEPLCIEAGIEPLFPLWGESRRAIAEAVLAAGIRALLVGVDTTRLDAGFCGTRYDASLLARLPTGVCPIGEDGEFHTFVDDAPGMASPVKVAVGATRLVPSRPPASPKLIASSPLRLVDGILI